MKGDFSHGWNGTEPGAAVHYPGVRLQASHRRVPRGLNGSTLARPGRFQSDWKMVKWNRNGCMRGCASVAPVRHVATAFEVSRIKKKQEELLKLL